MVKNTNTFIKSNPTATVKQIEGFITKESKKLSSVELEALQTITQKKNITLVKKEVDRLDNLSKKELKTTLTNKSDEMKNYLYGYNKKSKYWERQINASLFERIIVPSIIMVGVFMDDKTDVEAAEELNANGYKNITPEDVSVIMGEKELSEWFSVISEVDYENFEIVKKDSSKLEIINNISNLLSIVDVVGTDSTIYKEEVKPHINDSKILYDIYNTIKTDKELSNLEYRELSEDVDYRWYRFLDCENDPYNKSIIEVPNESKTQTKEYQDSINMMGSPLTLRGDSKYEYKEYMDYWFWRGKGNEGDWKLIKNCLACSKLQRQLNKELEEFKYQFDFENELNYELKKNKIL